MKKKLISLALALILELTLFSVTALAATASPTASTVLVNGGNVAFDAYNIDGNNYFKLRDISDIFDFGVDWDGAAQTIRIDTSISYTPEGGADYTGQVTARRHTLSNGVKGVYTGMLVSGMAQDANGRFVSDSGDVYTGGLSDNNLNGQGRCEFIDGRVYTGNWKDGLRSGQGTFTSVNGSLYEVEWANDKMNGSGTVKYPNGDVYVGEFKDGRLHGQGTYTWANDGGVYVGEFKDGRKNGQGTFTFSNGDKYVGEWANDARHGQGTMTKSDGTEYTGEWDNNDFLG